MFGVKKKVERVRAALVDGLKRKATDIISAHTKAGVQLQAIPMRDMARAMVLTDIADIISGVLVEDDPSDNG